MIKDLGTLYLGGAIIPGCLHGTLTFDPFISFGNTKIHILKAFYFTLEA